MTYYTARRRLLGYASSLALMGSLMTGATTQASTLSHDRLIGKASARSSAGPHANGGPGDRAAPTLDYRFWDALALEPQDAWARLRDNFQWQDRWQTGAGRQRVQHWIDRYRAEPHNIVQITERARPWLAWITERVEARGLPGEIALIPFVESSFDPEARSRFGAAGLWQIMPRTGEALGLKRNGAWDGRLDVVRSTEAALDYIEFQAEQWYEGDLKLSLAAYNAGAGTVNRAQRNARARGRSGDYWDLALPSETMDYVPKLLAIAAIIAEPTHYGIQLPEIDGDPAFAGVPVTRPVRLREAARLAGVPLGELAELNPGLRSDTVDPRHVRELQVPADSAERLIAALGTASAPAAAGDDAVHVVQRGDTLSAIASRHSVALADLARWNGIRRPDALQPGQQLTLSGS